uniref:Uncharacterized protein n=1 Tax=Parascaris equorum TaxID=6256 RepID=A0A914RK78_PAREQ
MNRIGSTRKSLLSEAACVASIQTKTQQSFVSFVAHQSAVFLNLPSFSAYINYLVCTYFRRFRHMRCTFVFFSSYIAVNVTVWGEAVICL